MFKNPAFFSLALMSGILVTASGANVSGASEFPCTGAPAFVCQHVTNENISCNLLLDGKLLDSVGVTRPTQAGSLDENNAFANADVQLPNGKTRTVRVDIASEGVPSAGVQLSTKLNVVLSDITDETDAASDAVLIAGKSVVISADQPISVEFDGKVASSDLSLHLQCSSLKFDQEVGVSDENGNPKMYPKP